MNKISMDKKYRTRDGRDVRVLCTDFTNHEQVVALVAGVNSSRENLMTFDAYGKYASFEVETPFDLIEVTPYEDFKIDDKVLVRRYESAKWTKRYFAGVDENGNPMTYGDGATSWSQHGTVSWKFCKKAED